MNAAAESILDPVVHGRLVENLDEVAMTARVPVFMLHKSAGSWLSPAEMNWLKEFRKHRSNGSIGWVFTGKQNPAIETKMMAAASALVRNFIDARVIPLSELLADEKSVEVPNPTVMLVPNFYVTTEGKPLASWQLQKLHSLLLARFVEQRPTILYVQEIGKMTQHYGDGIGEHVKQNYKTVES